MKLFEGDTAKVLYPNGRIPITEQLEWGVLYGGRLEGDGGILSDSEHQPNKGTRLVHEFDKAVPTMLYQSFDGSIDRVTFSGDPRLLRCPSDQRAACGILVDKAPDTGFGTGKLDFQDISFTQYDRAVTLGKIEPGQSSKSEHNADNLSAWRWHTHRCGTMLRVEHEQGVDVHIAIARPYLTPLVFDFEGGGNLSCQSVRAMTGVKTILRIGERVGSNSGKFVIGEGGVIVVDTNNPVPIFLQQDKRCAALEVTFANVRTGNSAPWPDEPIFQMQGGCKLTLNDFKVLKAACIEFKNTPNSSSEAIAKYRNHVNLADALTSGITDLVELFSPTCRGQCDVTVGSVTSVYGYTTIEPGRYQVTGTSQGVTISERPPQIVDVTAILAELEQLRQTVIRDSTTDMNTRARVSALESATTTPVDLEPLNVHVAAIEADLSALAIRTNVLEDAESVDLAPLTSRIDSLIETHDADKLQFDDAIHLIIARVEGLEDAAAVDLTPLESRMSDLERLQIETTLNILDTRVTDTETANVVLDTRVNASENNVRDLDFRVDALENATPVDLAPLESRMSDAESAIGQTVAQVSDIADNATNANAKADAAIARNANLTDRVNELFVSSNTTEVRLRAVGTAFKQVAADLLPTDESDGTDRL